jgi:hypothetical protein
MQSKGNKYAEATVLQSFVRTDSTGVVQRAAEADWIDYCHWKLAEGSNKNERQVDVF